MVSDYVKLYSGNQFEVQPLIHKLSDADIIPVVKDDSESARLAGFGTLMQGFKDVYVHRDEFERATQIISA